MKKALSLLCAAAFLLACTAKAPVSQSGLNLQDFENSYNGVPTALYTLTNTHGMEVCITNFGGRIVSIMVPDRNGDMKDVVLGFDKVQDYFPENNQTDFGAAIGRYANRINQGRFSLEGVEYQLPQNNFGHCLHGGPTGWQYQVYKVEESSACHLKLSLVSPDGDNGFPGNVTATVTYTLMEDNSLDIAYEATTDAPTVVNMTNHAYFNLSGDPTRSVEDHILRVNADCYTPVDETLIPTGEIAPVDGTPFDFREPKAIGRDIAAENTQLAYGRGYDHNWVLGTAGNESRIAASLTCPETGITLSIRTSEPGIQIYTGNFLDGTVTGKRGIAYPFRSAVCLETQHYPDSPNKEKFPSTVLMPGKSFQSATAYRFSIAQ